MNQHGCKKNGAPNHLDVKKDNSKTRKRSLFLIARIKNMSIYTPSKKRCHTIITALAGKLFFEIASLIENS
jgi:hypothetical protein